MRWTAGPLTLQKVARLSLLAVLGLFLVINAPAAFVKSLRRIKQGWALRHETLIDSRRRLFGVEYVDGIEAIRNSIPPDGEYVLVSQAGADEEAALWVRYDLAPRRALRLDLPEVSLASGRKPPSGRVQELPQHAVIARGRGKAPQLVATTQLFPGAPKAPLP
jgi:hypothetical protein